MWIAMASLITLIAAQMLFKHGEPWFPARILKVSFQRGSLRNGISKSRPYARWVETANCVPDGEAVELRGATGQNRAGDVDVSAGARSFRRLPSCPRPHSRRSASAGRSRTGIYLLAGYGLGAVSLLAMLQLT
jgi:hypothetical protein